MNCTGREQGSLLNTAYSRFIAALSGRVVVIATLAATLALLAALAAAAALAAQ